MPPYAPQHARPGAPGIDPHLSQRHTHTHAPRLQGTIIQFLGIVPCIVHLALPEQGKAAPPPARPAVQGGNAHAQIAAGKKEKGVGPKDTKPSYAAMVAGSQTISPEHEESKKDT